VKNLDGQKTKHQVVHVICKFNLKNGSFRSLMEGELSVKANIIKIYEQTHTHTHTHTHTPL
jgi:hypothetical protein